jgi:hypothetical protein
MSRGGAAGSGGRRERRLEKRTRQRISCKLGIEGREHSGIVLDVSPHGMFVQTKAKAAPGTPARIQLSVTGRAEPLVVEGHVARLERVPPAVAVIWTSGLGFNLVRPPAAWLELVAAFGGGTAAAGAPRRTEPPGREQSFCVRAALIQGTRTRTLLVRCASESAARELALAELGDEWKILSVESGRS